MAAFVPNQAESFTQDAHVIQEAIETGGFGVRTFSKFKINIFMQTSICKRVVVKGLK